MNNEPDFSVRNLEDYTQSDLETLYGAVLITKSDDEGMTEEIKQCLDVWLYRIKDAIAVARKREAEAKEDTSLLSSFKVIFKRENEKI